MAMPHQFSPSLPLLFWFFISIAAQSNCPSYNPCNGLNISYPFWRIDDNQTHYCGYQGFGINCYTIDGLEHPIILFDRASYYVETIDLTSIILVDYDVSPMVPLGNQCPPSVRHNIHLQPLPLDFSSYNVNLSFHFNCTGVPEFATEIPCLELDSGRRKSCVNVISLEAKGFDWSNYSCGEEVLKTVLNANLPSADRIGTEFGQVLSRGFELRWQSVEDCRKCENSNGRCGYSDVTANFMCLCSDGSSTTVDCNKGTCKFQFHPSIR